MVLKVKKLLEAVSKSHLRLNGYVAVLRQMLTYPCMLRFPDRPDALPLNLIWNFETTSNFLIANAIIPERVLVILNHGVVEL